jgi:hypothetical protein
MKKLLIERYKEWKKMPANKRVKLKKIYKEYNKLSPEEKNKIKKQLK